MQIDSNIPNQLWRLPRVMSATGLSKSEIYRRIKAGTLPAPIKIGIRAVAWESRLVTQYISQLCKEQGHV